jgi:hypothetical protein
LLNITNHAKTSICFTIYFILTEILYFSLKFQNAILNLECNRNSNRKIKRKIKNPLVPVGGQNRYQRLNSKRKSTENSKNTFGTGWCREPVQRSPFVPVAGSNRYQRPPRSITSSRGHRRLHTCANPRSRRARECVVVASPEPELCRHRRSRAAVSPKSCRRCSRATVRRRRPQCHALHSVVVARRSPTPATR